MHLPMGGLAKPETAVLQALPSSPPVGALTDWVSQHPLLVGVAIALLIVVVVGAIFVYYRRIRSKAKAFQKLFEADERVSVLMHPNPDPDAMAAAIGLGFLIEQAGASPVLQYPGQIRRPENRAFRTVLELDLESVESVSELNDKVVLADHNEARGINGAKNIDPIAVIDHHPGEGTGTAFTDIRTDYGASATIVAEYLDQLGYETRRIDDNEQPEGAVPTDVATGLMYGIQSDTNELTRGCHQADFNACAYLYEGIDTGDLDRIANPEVDTEVLEIKARAIEERIVRGTYCISNVGTISNIDAIPQAAEELLRLEGITATVVMGTSSGTIHLSGRSRDDRLHIGDALQAVVDDIPMSEAGGHMDMAGGQISHDHMVGIGPSNGMTIEDLRERIFQGLSGELQ